MVVSRPKRIRLESSTDSLATLYGTRLSLTGTTSSDAAIWRGKQAFIRSARRNQDAVSMVR